MTEDHAVQLAVKLMQLGVSRAGVADLLAQYPYDLIERQLTYLPFRKAKRKEALIVEAIRSNYSPPKEFYYASPQTPPAETALMDEDTESPSGSADAETPGYGASGPIDTPSTNDWLESRRTDSELILPTPEE